MSQSEKNVNNDAQERYSRQIRFAPIGPEGQNKLSKSRVVIIGCGALGSVLAETMTRAGVGHLHIVDRDFVELSNLQRQMLYDENDIKEGLPKAEAAARKLSLMNSDIEITPFIADANHESIEYFTEDVDLILDGTDNLLTRYLINDVAIKQNIPWIYGACQGAVGMVAVFLAGGKPCLRCLFDSPPAPGELETCETAGVLGPVVNMVASYQALEALKILTGNLDDVNSGLINIEPWQNRFHQMSMETLKQGCPCCNDGKLEFLKGKSSLSTVALCGRNSVQIRPRVRGIKLELQEFSKRLVNFGKLSVNEFMIKLNVDDYEITIFPDARAIIKGTEETDVARALYAKFVGH